MASLLYLLLLTAQVSDIPPNPVQPPLPLQGLSWATRLPLTKLRALLGPKGKIERYEAPTDVEGGALEVMGAECAVRFVLTRNPKSYVEYAIAYTPQGKPIDVDRINPSLVSLGLFEP